jgi:hypothetical protein
MRLFENAQDLGCGRVAFTYRSPKKLNIANTMTIAPTIQMILFMISLLVRKARASEVIEGRSEA